MKNINIYFGCYEPNRFSKFAYWLCTKLTFIPTFDIELFKTYHKSDKYFPVKHSMYFGIFHYFIRIYKFEKEDKNEWRFENLTNKR